MKDAKIFFIFLQSTIFYQKKFNFAERILLDYKIKKL